MAVKVVNERKLIEISWDPLAESGPPEEKPPDQPDGFPTHPIFLPPYPDQGLPGDQPRPDHELPGDQPRPDHELPGDQPRPDHELPGDQPRPDQGLPGEQPGVEQPIYLPPYVDNELPGAVRQKLREFLTGNLPEYVVPHGGKVAAVQVFAQGQDGDWSNTAVQPNDGLAALAYPKGFTGESYVEIRGLDGTLVDSGTFTVK
jgi:hypothetical protein